MRAYSDPEVRKKLHTEAIEWSVTAPEDLSHNWYDFMWVDEPVLEKNRELRGKAISEIAREQGKSIIDALLDLVVEENLGTSFTQGEQNVDEDAVTQILNYEKAVMGLSDGGAHVQYQGGYNYSTRFLGYWVREKHIMSLGKAVRRLTFESASAFGIYDRGLLHPGMAADITIFDPETVRPLPSEVVYDSPAGGWRVEEMAEGIRWTIVNGEVLLEDGKHTGALPGRVIWNALHPSSRR